MIVWHDGEGWVEFYVPDPRGRPTEKTIGIPLSVYLLAVKETRNLEELRARIFTEAAKFAGTSAAKKKRTRVAREKQATESTEERAKVTGAGK